MAGVLFEDIFDVKDIDPEGKKFDRGKITDFTSTHVSRQSFSRSAVRLICQGVLPSNQTMCSAHRRMNDAGDVFQLPV